MSDTTRDELREKITAILQNIEDDRIATNNGWQGSEYDAAFEIEQLINDHVLAVLERLEMKQSHYGDGVIAMFQEQPHIPLSALEQEKRNYAKQ